MASTDRPALLIRPGESANGRLRGSPGSGALDVEIEPDPLTGTGQWFHFSLRAPAGTLVRIVNAGACTYPGGWADSLVWSRRPGGGWRPRPLPPVAEDGAAGFTHGEPGGLASHALFPPYPVRSLAAIAQRAGAHPQARVVQADGAAGSALRISLGDPDPAAPQAWILCGQHGGEHPALWFADGFLDALLRRGRLPAGMRFHVVPVANPQGYWAGHLRTNAAGQDPNRRWGEPATCPEVRTLLDAMTETGVDLLLDVHADFETGCVYLDVLDEWLGTHPRLAAVRERFERGLAGRSPDAAFGRRYPWRAAPHPDLLAGMCAPAVERRFAAPAVTLELPIGYYRDASGKRGIWTPQHSRAFGRAAAAVLAEGM